MKRYEVSVQVNSYAFIVVNAANEEEAEAKARAVHWERWRLDTDYSTAEDYEVRESKGVIPFFDEVCTSSDSGLSFAACWCAECAEMRERIKACLK